MRAALAMGGGERGGGAGAAAGAGDGSPTGSSAATCARARAGWSGRWGGGRLPLRWRGAWRGASPSAERARALSGLGWLARFQGDSDRAEAAFGEALRTAAAAGARLTTASALSGLALVDLDRGRYEEAAARLDEALAVFLELEPALVGGPQYVSGTHACRGRIALAAGDLAGAARYLEEAARRQRELGFAWGLSRTLRWLGDLARARGDLDAALGRYRESLELAQESGDQLRAADALDGVAGVAAARGQAERAARLLRGGGGAARAARRGGRRRGSARPASATWPRRGRRWSRPRSRRPGRRGRRCRWRRPSPRRWPTRVPTSPPAARRRRPIRPRPWG